MRKKNIWLNRHSEIDQSLVKPGVWCLREEVRYRREMKSKIKLVAYYLQKDIEIG